VKRRIAQVHGVRDGRFEGLHGFSKIHHMLHGAGRHVYLLSNKALQNVIVTPEAFQHVHIRKWGWTLG
jgi:hypothetical protein